MWSWHPSPNDLPPVRERGTFHTQALAHRVRDESSACKASNVLRTALARHPTRGGAVRACLSLHRTPVGMPGVCSRPSSHVITRRNSPDSWAPPKGVPVARMMPRACRYWRLGGPLPHLLAHDNRGPNRLPSAHTHAWACDHSRPVGQVRISYKQARSALTFGPQDPPGFLCVRCPHSARPTSSGGMEAPSGAGSESGGGMEAPSGACPVSLIKVHCSSFKEWTDRGPPRTTVGHERTSPSAMGRHWPTRTGVRGLSANAVRNHAPQEGVQVPPPRGHGARCIRSDAYARAGSAGRSLPTGGGATLTRSVVVMSPATHGLWDLAGLHSPWGRVKR